MENETQKPEVKSRGILEILKGTIIGLDGEGSAKRATSFYFVVVLLTAMIGFYLYEFKYIIHKSGINGMPAPITTVDTAVIGMYEYIFTITTITVWLLLGLATLETITKLVQIFKGQKTEDAK
jgi:hypothetical protein